MSDDLPDRMLSSDGQRGWYAFPPDGHDTEKDDEQWEGPEDGSLIRFMAEESADVPLWGPTGLIFVDGEELAREWGVNRELVADIVQWGRDSLGPVTADLDAEAARMVRSLAEQTNYRFRIVYHP